MADKPVAVLTARVQMDKQESFKRFEADFKDFQAQVDKKNNAIVYKITGDDSDLENILKKLEDSDVKLGIDVVLEAKNSKKLQDQIKKLMEAVSMGIKSTDLGIVDEIKKELATTDKEIAKQQKKLDELNKKKSEATKNQKSSDELYKSIEASHKRLQSYNLSNSAYTKEVKNLRDLAAAYKEITKQTETNKGQFGIINAYLNSEKDESPRYKGNAANILGNVIDKTNQEQIKQVENLLKELQTKREEIQNRLNQAIEEAQKRATTESGSGDGSGSGNGSGESGNRNYKINVDATDANKVVNDFLSNLDNIEKPRSINISNLEEVEKIAENIAASLSNLGYDLSNSQKNSLGDVIKQMVEADELMKKSDTELRERILFYNKDNKKFTNAFVSGDSTSISNKLEDNIRKKYGKNFNSHLHTHPEKYAAISLAQFDKNTKSFNGDLLHYMKEGFEEAIVVAREQVQIFNSKLFSEDFGKYFNSSNLPKLEKNLEEATHNVFDNYQKNRLLNNEISIDWEGLLLNKIPSDNEVHKILQKSLKNGNLTEQFVKYFIENQKDDFDNYSDEFGGLKDRLQSFIYDLIPIETDTTKVGKILDKSIESIWKSIKIDEDTFQQLYANFTPEILTRAFGAEVDWKKYVKTLNIDEFKKEYGYIEEELEKDAKQNGGIQIPISPLLINPEEFINEISKKLEGHFVEVGILPVAGDEDEIKRRVALIADAFKSQLGLVGDAASELPEKAAEVTAETQESKSPSKVAELLGEYWGEGYAEGILKHKDDVADAVAELVKTGQLTVGSMMGDFAYNILSDNQYKDLIDPVKNYIGSNMDLHKAADIDDLREQYKILRVINADLQGRANKEKPILGLSVKELEKSKQQILELNPSLVKLKDSVEGLKKIDFINIIGGLTEKDSFKPKTATDLQSMIDTYYELVNLNQQLSKSQEGSAQYNQLKTYKDDIIKLNPLLQQCADHMKAIVSPAEFQKAMGAFAPQAEAADKAVKITVKEFNTLLKQIPDLSKLEVDELEKLVRNFMNLPTPKASDQKALEAYGESYNLLSKACEKAGYEYDKTSKKLVKIGEATKKASATTTEETKKQEKAKQITQETAKVNEQATQTTGELAEGYEYVSNKVNKLNEDIKKYIELSEVAFKGNRNIIDMKYNGQADKISSSVDLSDVRKNRTTKTSIRKQLDYYLEIKEELEKGINKYGETTLFKQRNLDNQLDKLAAYVYSFHNAEEAAEIFGKKNKEVFEQVQEYIRQSEEASENYKRQNWTSQRIISSLSNYGVESIKWGQRDQLMKAIKAGGLQAYAEKVKELFGVEIPLAVKKTGEVIEEQGSVAQQQTTSLKAEEQQAEATAQAEQKVAEARQEASVTKPTTGSTTTESGTSSTTLSSPILSEEQLQKELAKVRETIDKEKGIIKELEDELSQEVPKAIQKKNEEFDGEVEKVREVVNKEKAILEELKTYLDTTIPSAIDVKNNKFNEEIGKVKQAIDEEIGHLDRFRSELEKPVSIDIQKDEEKEFQGVKELDNTLKEIIEKINLKIASFSHEEDRVKEIAHNESISLQEIIDKLEKIKALAIDMKSAFQGIKVDGKIDVKGIKDILQFEGKDFTTVANSLKSLFDALNKLKLGDKSFIKQLDSILAKGKELDNLVKVLKTSEKKIAQAKENVKSDKEKNREDSYKKELDLEKQKLALEKEYQLLEAKGDSKAEETKAKNLIKINQLEKERKQIVDSRKKGETSKELRDQMNAEIKAIKERDKADIDAEKQATKVRIWNKTEKEFYDEKAKKAKEAADAEAKAVKEAEKEKEKARVEAEKKAIQEAKNAERIRKESLEESYGIQKALMKEASDLAIRNLALSDSESEFDIKEVANNNERIAEIGKQINDIVEKRNKLDSDSITLHRELLEYQEQLNRDYQTQFDLRDRNKATEHNENAITAYKELIKTANEYYNLQINTLGKDDSNPDVIRLKELIDKWEEARKAKEEYNDFSVNKEGSNKSIQDLKEVEEQFANIEAQVSAKIREGLVKELPKYIKLDNENKYIDEFSDKVKEVIQLIDSIDKHGLDLSNPTDVQRVHQIREDIAFINSEKGLSKYKAASETRIKQLQLQIRQFQNNNSAMGKTFSKQFDDLFNQFSAARSIAEVDELKGKFASLEAEVVKAGKTGKSFFRTFVEHLKSTNAQLLSTYLSLQDFIRYGRTAFETVRQLDTALVDLKKTTTMNNTDLEEFYQKSNDIAKQMGVTTQEIIDQASQWSRLGFSTKEQSESLAQLSSKFASISPGMTSEQAQSGMVSIMKAWDISTDQVEREVLDNINILGNRFAETNLDIVEGMQRSAAAMAAVGEDWRNAFALFTGGKQLYLNVQKCA